VVSARDFFDEMLAGVRVSVLTNFAQEVCDIPESSTRYRNSAAERSLTEFLVKQSSIWLVLMAYNALTMQYVRFVDFCAPQDIHCNDSIERNVNERNVSQILLIKFVLFVRILGKRNP
jgi:hypothetical protein